MKKFLFIVSACITMTFASCTHCTNNHNTSDQDTLYVYDTLVVEEFDTVAEESVAVEVPVSFIDVDVE